MARYSKSLGPGLAKRLRLAIKSRRMTIRGLAKASGCGTSTLMRICRGDGGNAGVGLLVDIARALDVAPGWLILGEGKGPP